MFVPLALDEEHRLALENIDDEEQRKLTAACLSAFMVLAQNRSPIKKSDLNRLVFSGQKYYKAVNAIVIAANKELDKIYGMRLFELEDKSKYLLVNSRADYTSYALRSSSDCQELTVLYFVLMEIFASPEEKISEADMMDMLKALDLSEKDLKKHIDSLVKRLYISVTKDAMHQDMKFVSWGPRAEAEVDPDNFFNSFLKLTEDGSESNWPEQKRRIDKLKAIPNR